MSERESKKKKKKTSDAEVLTWRQKKERADKEEDAVRKEVEEIISWTAAIEAMDDKQLKEYVMNRPESLQSVRTGKAPPDKKARRSGKARSSSSSSSQGLMATVWKFHREDEEAPITFQV